MLTVTICYHFIDEISDPEKSKISVQGPTAAKYRSLRVISVLDPHVVPGQGLCGQAILDPGVSPVAHFFPLSRKAVLADFVLLGPLCPWLNVQLQLGSSKVELWVSWEGTCKRSQQCWPWRFGVPRERSQRCLFNT